jgi:hypothetical protein
VGIFEKDAPTSFVPARGEDEGGGAEFTSES